MAAQTQVRLFLELKELQANHRIFKGGIVAYSSPVPDLLGALNVSSDQSYWEEQSHGLLTNGLYGLQDIHINTILTYGK